MPSKQSKQTAEAANEELIRAVRKWCDVRERADTGPEDISCDSDAIGFAAQDVEAAMAAYDRVTNH